MAAEAMDLEKTVTKCSVKKLRFFEHDIIWPLFYALPVMSVRRKRIISSNKILLEGA